MIGTLILLGVLVISIALGRWLEQRALLESRHVLKATAIAVAVPIVVLLFANMVDSDALGWIAGLSLWAMAITAVPVGLGLLLGRKLTRGSREQGHGSSTTEAAASSRSLNKAPKMTPREKPASPGLAAAQAHRRGLLANVAGMLAVFWIVIALGFRLHDQPVPMELEAGLLPAIVVLMLVVFTGVRRVWQRRRQLASTAFRPPTASEQAAALAAREAWLTAIAADPVRQRYVAMIEAGDRFWTPERVDYDLNLQATGCCEHLAPIESAMRAVGVQTRLQAAGSVTARCCIDPEALARTFALNESLLYQEVHTPDLSTEDPPHVFLFCVPCQSRLWSVHRDDASLDTPTFPALH